MNTTTEAAFSVRGSRNGSPVTVSWSPGALAGDPPTVDLILAELEIARACVGDGVYDAELQTILAGHEDPLADPYVAYALFERVLDAIRTVDGKPADLVTTLQRRREGHTTPRAHRKE